MKRKFALLAALGTLVALALPAVSMGALYPLGHKFEIGTSTYGPRLETSLGSCPISKITGQIPTTATGEVTISAPTIGTCTPGTSLTLSGEWHMSPTSTSPIVDIVGVPGQLTMRFSSLPGCKLSNAAAAVLRGIWSNGTTTPSFMKTVYTPDASSPLTWANDGATCALAGQQEAVSYTSDHETGGFTFPGSSPVTDLTSPSSPVLFAPSH